MAKALNINTAPETVENAIRTVLTGIGGGFDASKYKINSGSEVAARDRSFNMLVFGEIGTGKTYLVVELLRLGFKVVMLITDYGKTGDQTVYSYFADHPEEAHLLANLRSVVLDYAGMNAFSRTPEIFPGFADIYTWDPDFVFWDGTTAYQEIEAEKELAGSDRNDDRAHDWGAFRQIRNATVYPMDRILALHNTLTGRPWNKVFTALEKIDGEWENVTGRDGKPERVMRPGTRTIGPALHTSARKILPAGFDLVVRSVKDTSPKGKETFWYETAGSELVVKSRGYGLPPRVAANFVDIWKTYIGPKVSAFMKAPATAATATAAENPVASATTSASTGSIPTTEETQ